MDDTFLAQARSYKEELRERLYGVSAHSLESNWALAAGGMSLARQTDDNIVGIGFGLKQVEGRYHHDLAVRVYVRSKLAVREMPTQARIPPAVNGMPTDVIEVNTVIAHGRPVNCGASIGHAQFAGTGTLGCLVQKLNRDGRRYILSNNHVLTNLNRCAVDDHIIEPSPQDNGKSPIARLAEWHPLDFSGKANKLDAAIATLIDVADVHPDIHVIGRVHAPVWPASLGDRALKYGRATKHTEGQVVDVAADLRVRYGAHFAFFEDAIAIEGSGSPFSQHGDSGALVVEKVSRRPLGLLFSGGNRTSFACSIQDVLDHFKVEIV